MADGRRDDWRWRQQPRRAEDNRYGEGEHDRTDFGSRGPHYPDGPGSYFGADRRRDFASDPFASDYAGDSWDRNERLPPARNYRDERGFEPRGQRPRFTTDPDPRSSDYPDRVGRGGYGGGDRNWMDKAGDEMASWFGSEEASERRDVDRRRDGHYGRGPKGYRRSDQRILEDVNDRLTDDWQVDASEIVVEVSEAEVTLSGTVSSRAEKRRAEDLADAVSGVTHVQNNLRVQRPVGESGERTTPGNGGYI